MDLEATGTSSATGAAASVGGQQHFTVSSRQLENGVVLELRGELDLATVPIVQREMRQAKGFHDLVVIDLRQVSFMDSAGLQLLLSLQKRMRERGGSLLVVQGSRQVRRLFELTGIIDQLQLIDDPAAAPGLSL